MKSWPLIDMLMIVIMNVIDMLSYNWCFLLHRDLPSPDGTNKAKEEQATTFSSSVAGGAAAKPSTSQPAKKKVVREGAVNHPDNSKVWSRAAQDSPNQPMLTTFLTGFFTKRKDVKYQGPSAVHWGTKKNLMSTRLQQ